MFIDEIDKIVEGSGGGRVVSGGVSSEGVQRDLLPIIEGSAVQTKYGTLNTDHVLFIASGAFHTAKPTGGPAGRAEAGRGEGGGGRRAARWTSHGTYLLG